MKIYNARSEIKRSLNEVMRGNDNARGEINIAFYETKLKELTTHEVELR